MPQRRANTIGQTGVLTALAAAMVWAPLTARTQAAAPVPPAAAPEQMPQAQVPPSKPAVKPKGKQPYAGPTALIELPPAPMLDGEGKQRLDPEGKPMFDPPVKQQRDKSGHPLFDGKGQPVFQTATELGYDEHGKKLNATKDKPPRTIAISIAKGTLTVDGMIAKAGLNYEIGDLRYIYLYAPWIGTVVVSNTMFPGAKEQAGGFDRNTLTINVGDHTFQLYSEKAMLGKKPESAFVLVDRNFKLPSQRPEVGYGATLNPPYAWPGAKMNAESKAFVKPPPVPVSLRPTQLLPPCPAGQMRSVSHVVLPGEDAPPQPCVPILNGRAAVAAAKPVPAPAPAAAAPAMPAPPVVAQQAPAAPSLEQAGNGNPAAIAAVVGAPATPAVPPPSPAMPPR